MQNISDIHKKISFNREIFRSEIRSAKNEDLFLSKRLKYQSSDTENQHSDDQLIKNLIQTSDSNEIAQYLEELRCRSSHLEENSYFLNNPLLPNLIPILLNFLKSPELQYVCCWILINLMIGKTPLIKFCISLGLLKELLQIVEKNDVAMREQVIFKKIIIFLKTLKF